MTETATHKRQILKSASIISIITVVSRILGYVRDQRLTLLLGTTGIADSFILAYRIPNVLRRLVGEGSMTASFIPVFTDYMRNRTREETWEFANRLFWTFSVILSALTVLGVIFSPLFVRFFSMFGKNQVQLQAVYLNRLMFPYILFIGMAALAMAILNCFPYFRAARGHAHPAEYLLYCVLGSGGVEAFFKSGGGAGRGRAGGWNFSIFPAGAATGQPGNEFQVCAFRFRIPGCGAWRG